jgi:trehalose/maltose transport system substrate-binding protein
MPRHHIVSVGNDLRAQSPQSPFSSFRRRAFAGFCFLVLLFAGPQACQKPSQPPPSVKITLIDVGWWSKEFIDWRTQAIAGFTRETGIQVEIIPAPESTVEQLALWRKLLASDARVPDVYAVDMIWPGILAEDLVDLKAYVPAQEIAAQFTKLIENNTVNGRLVALPATLDTGVLYYRADLLKRYGYKSPPATWDDLERMARRIQAGERARGRKNFWGFVWQGAASEALTCNALEWQVSEGGGTIVENGRITVNNPQTVRVWERAARWVGSISPPGVVAYQEWDTFNLWQPGDAAFMRNWATGFALGLAQNSPFRGKIGVTSLPAGRAGSVGALGGLGYGVSRHSLHPQEAAALVRYLARRDVQASHFEVTGEPPTLPELYSDPKVVMANSYLPILQRVYAKGVVLRPSAVTGKNYHEVSRAYFEAVHAVLTGKKSAAQSAADLQNELVRITRLAAGVPGPGVPFLGVPPLQPNRANPDESPLQERRRE